MRRMLIRRFGQNRRNLGIATLAIAFLFCVYLYYDLLNQLKLNDERNQRLKALQNSLSTQLQVVYEHKSRLERAIQDEKDHHHKTKEAKQDLEIKLNREKQELQNRIQSLSQKQQIIQTQFEDLQKELSKSEADFQLMKSDYQKEIEDYKEKIFIQSQQCDRNRKYLSEEMDDLKQSQKEMSNSLAQCQESVKNLQLQIHDLKREPVLYNLADNVNKLSLQVNQSQDSFVHINPNSVPSALVKDNAFVQNNGQGKDENDDKKVALAFQSVDVVNNPVPVHTNRTLRQQKEDEDQQLQAAPPPRAMMQKHQQPIREAEPRNENGHFDRDLQNRAKDAIIEAPNNPEEKEQPDKNLNEDEDQEEADEKNGQNEADQKDDDDYQYDKNVDDEEKNEEKDDFPDAILANKNLNKIQNPVYPDDVEVVNH